MSNPFFDRPILNSPYEYPARHWELDDDGQPTQRIIEKRRPADFITPIPKPRKRGAKAEQRQIVFDEGLGLSTAEQAYETTAAVIRRVREHVDAWRKIPNPADWKVTPETARLLQHWRQVIGRALRRQPYDLNEENLNLEYADVLGLPFDFTAKPVVSPPQPPRQTIHVKAVRSCPLTLFRKERCSALSVRGSSFGRRQAFCRCKSAVAPDRPPRKSALSRNEGMARPHV